jgi:hypothetical protein
VTIELSGANPGSQLPWHIHSGACNGKGSIWGEPSMYPPLRVGQEGAVTGAVTLPVVLPSNGEYAVTVHKSADDMAPVACGALLQVPMPEPVAPLGRWGSTALARSWRRQGVSVQPGPSCGAPEPGRMQGLNRKSP